MTKKPLVSVIIVNWNGGKIFLDCLKSLTKIEYPNWEIILVDNASWDGSEKHIHKVKLSANTVKTIINEYNVGFAPANNQGYQEASGEYILLLNNDTKVQPDLLTCMVKKMESDSKIGAMQPKIKLMDKEGYLDNAGSFLTTKGFLKHWGFMEKDGSEFDHEQEVFSAKGACLMTRKNVIEKVGLFDDEFVSYFEESDFCWRVWLAGYKVIYAPVTSIEHKLGFTSKRMYAIDVNYHSIKNRFFSLFKNLNFKNLFTIFLFHIALNLGLAIYYLLKFQFAKFWMIVRAFKWNILNIGKLISRRTKVQKLRKKTDDEIFEKVLVNLSFKDLYSHFLKVEENFK